MPEQATLFVDSLKRDAARLLKQARAGDPAALNRFAVLRSPPETLQLKHALAVVADEAGFDSWTDMKHSRTGLDFSEFFAGPSLRDSLNPWFNNYEEARAFLETNGGVLLPYRHHFFVSSLAILERLGFEADHPDWRDIGYDFVRPKSESALNRIKASLQRRFGER